MTLLMATLHSYAASDPFGNEFINVFGYRSNVPVINELSEFVTSFNTHVLPAIQDIVSDDMFYTRLEVRNMTDGVGYLDTTYSPAEQGHRSGQSMPRFVAWGFKIQRASIGKRSGGKRFGKIVESDQDNGSPTSGALTLLNACADALAFPLPIGIDSIWFPEILERKPAGTFPWTSHPIAGVVFSAETSQNTRKR